MTEILNVDSPEHEGKQVPFLFLYWSGAQDKWNVIFDFSLPEERCEDWQTGKRLADAMNIELLDRSLNFHNSQRDNMEKVGLWPAPALMPYPLTAMVEHCKNDKTDEALGLLRGHCSPDFIDELIRGWAPFEPCKRRHTLFSQAAMAYRRGEHALVVHALVPHIEGIVTDFVISKIGPDNVKFRIESKTEQLKGMIQDRDDLNVINKRVANDAIDFLLNGPVYRTFQRWIDPIGTEYPGRHAVGHGRYDENLYIQDNSIKAFLTIDTLCQIMLPL